MSTKRQVANGINSDGAGSGEAEVLRGWHLAGGERLYAGLLLYALAQRGNGERNAERLRGVSPYSVGLESKGGSRGGVVSLRGWPLFLGGRPDETGGTENNGVSGASVLTKRTTPSRGRDWSGKVGAGKRQKSKCLLGAVACFLLFSLSAKANWTIQPIDCPLDATSWQVVLYSSSNVILRNAWGLSPAQPYTFTETGSSLLGGRLILYLYNLQNGQLRQSVIYFSGQDYTGKALLWNGVLQDAGEVGYVAYPFTGGTSSSGTVALSQAQLAQMVSDVSAVKGWCDTVSQTVGFGPFSYGFSTAIPFVVFYLYRRAISRGMGHVQ